MKKILLLVSALIILSLTSFAANGWFSDYVKIDVNGVGTSPAPTGWYWIGGDPSYATQLNGINFGTVNSLVITGCDMKYWSNEGRDGGAFYYKIMDSDNSTVVVAEVEKTWTQAYLGGNDFQGTTTISDNILTGLTPGTTYKLHIWAKSWGAGGDSWLNNGGANYVATFTTVAAPVAYNVTGTGSYCFGNAGLAVGLDDSETGVTYTLYKDNVAQTPTVDGTGEAISFGVKAVGTYTVKGTRSVFTTDMTGSAIITENPTSVGGTISGGTNVCSGTNSTLLTLADHVGSVIKWQYSTDGLVWEDIANSVSTSYTATDLTVTTQYQAIVKSGECASATSSVVTITVNPLPAAVTVLGAGTFCSTATLTASNGDDGIIYFQGTTSGGTSTLVESTSEVITTSGTYYFRAQSAQGCWGAEGSAVVTINTPVTTSVGIVASANPVVSGTSVEFTATPFNGGTPSYAWYLDGNLQPLITTSTFSTNPIQGTQVYVIMTSSLPCTSPIQSEIITMTVTDAPASSTWNGSASNIWHNAANWSNGVPGGTTDVTIPAGLTNFPTISSAAVCHDITLKSGASILGNNNLTVKGTASVEREISGGAWHLISSPVSLAKSSVFLHDYLQKWDEPTAKWTDIENENELLTIVHGYSLYETTPGTSVFTGGALNEGTRSKTLTVTPAAPITNRGANLVGNPYPSYLDWNTVSGYGACYVWNGSAYLAYPATGGYGTGSRYIAPAQGFFVMATSNGNFTLSNSNRVHNPGPFYKSSAEIPSNSLMLEAFGNNYSDKLIIRYDEETTQDFDMETDAHKLPSSTDGISQLYSYSGDKKLSIDVRPSCELVQLGFTNTLSGQYQISISEMNSISKATLEDTKTATFHDLLKGPYSFSYTAGEDDKRFKIRMGTVGIENPASESYNIYSNDKTAVIDLPIQTIGDVFIYNLAGQLIASKESATGQVRINLNATGVYIVKVILDSEVATQKIWIR